jgi:glycosyltransferase involved in cell wall biosynthesis
VPKILRIINRLNLGGPTFNAALLSKHLSPEFETMLLAGVRQDSEESSAFIVKEMGLTFTELPDMQRAINPVRDYKAYREIVRIIRKYRPDIVHTHAAKAGALGRLAAFSENVPVVVHTFHGHVFHSYFSPAVSKFFQTIERRLARRTSAVIALSEKQKSELSDDYRICPPEKIRVIPLGFDLSRFTLDQEQKRKEFRSQYFLREDQLAIGIIGRLVPVKNHPMFLEAARQLLQRYPERLRFFLIGDGESRGDLIRQCESSGIEHVFFPDTAASASVTFTGWRRDIDTVTAGLDIVALTSWNEGTPVSLIEAQASGKPVITTRVGGIENVVRESECARLVPPGDIDSFVSALSALIQDPNARTGTSLMQMREHVLNQFHYSRLCADMTGLYRELLSEASKKV